MPTVDFEDLEIALRDLTGIFQIISIVMLIPIAATLYYKPSHDLLDILKRMSAFIVPSLISYITYLSLKRYVTTEKVTKTKHALIAVVFAWIFVSLIGSMPFMLRGTLGVVDSVFESVSGWATTGMTMIEYPENLRGGDEDILLYRSLTHLVGGVGIIAFALMVFMHSGTAAIVYYSSEVGGQQIKTGIRKTIIETWKIYLLYALAGVVLLYLAGMTPFDAINHSFAAIATGGFSTHSESIGYYDSPLIELVIIFIMLVGAISFIVHFKLFEGNIRQFVNNIETKYMFGLIAVSTAVIGLFFLLSQNISGVDTHSVFDVFRKSIFQVISSITSSGFSTVNAGEWPHLAQTILMMLMYTGGFYGSTTGGIKLLRLAVVMASIKHTLKKMVLPSTAVVTMKLNNKTITDDEILYVLALSTIWLMIAFLGAMILMALGYTGLDSMSLSLSAMGNVGLVYVTGAPWYHMPAVGKITLTMLMWIGRLEIFPIIFFMRFIFSRRR